MQKGLHCVAREGIFGLPDKGRSEERGATDGGEGRFAKDLRYAGHYACRREDQGQEVQEEPDEPDEAVATAEQLGVVEHGRDSGAEVEEE